MSLFIIVCLVAVDMLDFYFFEESYRSKSVFLLRRTGVASTFVLKTFSPTFVLKMLASTDILLLY
jgi:hypothetical protein